MPPLIAKAEERLGNSPALNMFSSRDLAFDTERLLVREWNSIFSSDWHENSLPEAVVRVMTAKVTASLPDEWQGDFTFERAVEWIKERNQEGSTLMIVARDSKIALGFIILHFLSEGEDEGAKLRLGYMLSEASWGQGLGSEIVARFLQWALAKKIGSILAGVALENRASQRVLEKNGFQVIESSESERSGELLYEWTPLCILVDSDTFD